MSFSVLSHDDTTTLLNIVDDDENFLTGECVSEASGSVPIMGLVDEHVIVINYGGECLGPKHRHSAT